MQYTQVRLLKYASVLFLMLDDGRCSTLDGKCSTPKWGSWSTPQCCSWCYMMASAVHLMGNAVHPSEAPEVHPNVVPDVRWWPLQCTWWQMQYTEVRLLKYTPVLFLMLDDGFCSTLDGKCSTPKWGSWSAPSVVPDVRWWPLQYTQVKLLMHMMAYSVHLLGYTVHHVRLLIYMIGYADHLMANAVHASEAPEVHLSVVPNVRWWPLQYTWWQVQYTQVRLLKYIGQCCSWC